MPSSRSNRIMGENLPIDIVIIIQKARVMTRVGVARLERLLPGDLRKLAPS